MVANTVACPRPRAPDIRSKAGTPQRTAEARSVRPRPWGRGHDRVRALDHQVIHCGVRRERRIQRATQKVRYGSKASRPADPTRAGHTFQGWYTARDGGSRYDFSRTVTGDVTLYAHWSVNSYTLTFDGNGGKASESSRTVQYGSSYGALPTAMRTGYTFQGWYTAKDGGSQVSASTTMGAADTTVYAHWTIRSYTVAFDANGGSAVASQTVKYGAKATQPANPTAPDTRSKAGTQPRTEARGTTSTRP